MFYPKLSDVRDIWITDSNSNTKGLNGVSSFQFRNDSPKKELNILGAQTSNVIFDGPFDYNINISRNLLGPDLIWSRTGDSDLLVVVAFDSDRVAGETVGYISLSNGFVTDYSVAMNAGEIPQTQASFNFNNGKSFYDASATSKNYMTDPYANRLDYTPQYVPQTGIVLNVGNDDNGQVVTSANFSAKFNWIKEPLVISDVNDATNRGDYFISKLVRPIQYSASIQMTVDAYGSNVFGFTNPKTWELNVNCETGLIATYTIPNAELVGESVNVTADGLTTVNLEYIGVG